MTNYWSYGVDYFGDYGDQYLFRAQVARFAIGANLPQDAVYAYGTLDGDGNELNGSKDYVLSFAELPPVNPDAFWSVTIYNLDGTLVDNKEAMRQGVDYNAIGVPMIQQHEAWFEDGSLNLYLQSRRPRSDGAFNNWLPTPRGRGFIVFLRMYWPDPVVTSGRWKPPPIKRA